MKPKGSDIEGRPTRTRDERRDSDGLELLIIADDPDVVPELDTPIVGERFGKYLLVGELAQGGMAEIYLAVQKGVQGYMKVVSVKRVLPHLNNSPDFVAMFIDEARLGARLDHPNIVRTYEFGEEEGQYYTVMEYLPGEDVSKLLQRLAQSSQQLPLNLCVHIIMQVCSGLHFAHELPDTSGNPMGLVHRDVNPSNIVITYSGEVKIIDFGVAKANTNASQTLAGTIKGKLAYMSPEQVLGTGVDRRSDVFSTGVVLWELLTSRPLFSRENEAATLYAIMNDAIPSVRSIRPDVPRELDAMVARALAREPSDRFESCETMQFALESFLGTQPKVDARTLTRTMEAIFGISRAQAKRSIAQTRSLSKNVSLVMKLRTDVRADLAESLDAAKQHAVQEQQERAPVARPSAPTSRRGMIAVIAILLGGMASGLGFLSYGSSSGDTPGSQTAQQGILKVDSTPVGAAIFLGGEPTGFKTPATLSGIAVGNVTIRVELAGHVAVDDSFAMEPGQTVERHLKLSVMRGRLVLAGLPSTASVWVDNVEQIAGEVITVPAGRHEVRIDVGGETIVKQTIETATGHQVWELADRELVRR